MNHAIEQINELVNAAGAKFLSIYSSDFSVAYKQDKSPLTQTDMLADEALVALSLDKKDQLSSKNFMRGVQIRDRCVFAENDQSLRVIIE